MKIEPEDQTGIEGRIVEISDESFLVVENISKEEAVEISGENILNADVGGAYWFSGVEHTKQYEEGQLVRVSTSTIMESYPAQAEAESIEALDE
ncbi:DUF3221 domain-containing protein [Alteribacter populi]|uniref:DUF3221 domain-containing protein n=1 Tax=Alteribacter populi TaxID=2011011 RepID=UPI000BBAF338|nr:DUF3221 domain-containing protein [Alteribacter populi]